MNLLIRNECEQDFRRVEEITRAAFSVSFSKMVFILK